MLISNTQNLNEVRNVKNSAFFFIFFCKMFGILKIYINFEEIIKIKGYENTT